MQKSVAHGGAEKRSAGGEAGPAGITDAGGTYSIAVADREQRIRGYAWGMKVFLSSTALDLVAYRQVADDTILRMSQEAVAMERFGPLPGEPVTECERKARECDVLVCIVAHRYGFVPEKGRGSITRREVEAAKAAGREVLVWIVADDHPWTEKKEQDLLTDPTVLADPARVAEVAAGVQALLDFKAWLRANFTPETFTTPDDLGRKIALALGLYLRRETQGRSVSRQHVFISYVRENRERVDQLVAALRQAGVLVWIDRENIDPGQNWRIAIKRAIKEGAFFLACFSREYAQRDSTYMNEELAVAIDELRVRPFDRAWLIPIRLDTTTIPSRPIDTTGTLADLQWVDLSSQWDVAVARLIDVIHRAAGRK